MKTSLFVNDKVKRLVGLFLIVLGSSLMTVIIYSQFFRQRVIISAEQPQIAHFTQLAPNSDHNSFDFTYAAEKTVHAVVHVKTTSMQSTTPSGGGSFYDFFFGDRGGFEQKLQPVAGFGSGVIISSEGYIVTNNHVIDEADKVEVTLNNKHSYTAEVVGRDPNSDIAVLKIKETNLPFITYGNSDEIKVGEWVLAVGNPYNLTSTVTAGIVSAKARNLNILGERSENGSNYAIESFIQTDAAVNPGNSGGALVNTKGELIGINTAIASPTGSYIGNSFAIPVTIVKKVVSDIIEYGKVQRALLGVSIKDIDEELLTDKKIDKMEGVYVAGIAKDGAAEAAGIKEGDIILSINNINVNSTGELQEQISRFRPNDKVDVVINHENKRKQISVVLRNMEGSTKIVTAKDEDISILGAQLSEASPVEKHKLGIKSGVKVLNLTQGKLKNEGVQKGFIITQINNHPVYSVEDVKHELSGFKGGVLIEGVYPNGIVAYYAFGV